METKLILELPNDVRQIEHAVECVMQRCSPCRMQERKLKFNFRVSLTEALSNAILYGNGKDSRKRVRIEVVVSEHEIKAHVTDEGVGFDPGGVPNPTTPEHLEDCSGRGLFLMRELMDEVHFNESGNQVTLVIRGDEGAEGRGGEAEEA